ncbi:MAG: hypothetical protein AMXMBFR81_08280 [Chthonomonas sp.]
MSREIFTIGVYGTTESGFFQALSDHGITHFVDVRRRRGVRGSLHTYANAKALEAKLSAMGITYVHRQDLSPSLETRALQKAADAASDETKRGRTGLAPAFVQGYESDCLNHFDAVGFLTEFPADARIVLFCVESLPEACHRSLLAERLAQAEAKRWFDITPRS